MESKIIECIKTTYNNLKPGLTESIYQKALALELKEHFKTIELEKSVPIVYKDHEIAVLRADIVIDNTFILELKATSTKLSDKEECQLLRYMQILNIPKGILVNFSKDLQLKTCNLINNNE